MQRQRACRNREPGCRPERRRGHRARCGGGRLLSPLVRRLAAEHNIDVAGVVGTGAGGRIRREDIEKAISSGQTPTAARLRPPHQQRPPRSACRAEGAKAATDSRDEVVPLSRMRLISRTRSRHHRRSRRRCGHL
jgi:2-oxoglutarate dehydrogenase E2 component (dihydrolipoamide succinyltransferase)